MPRLFVAAWPPPEVAEAITGAARQARAVLGPDAPVRWTTPEQWHVTLRFLGAVPDAAALSEALAGAPLPVGPLATLGPGVAWLGRRVLHVPVAGLDDLAGVVAGATAGFGREKPGHPFTGHVTLARVREARGRPRAVGGVAGLVGVEVAGSWTVDEVTLVESHLSAAGARYEVLGRWRLGPR
ncbi:MAG: RNA 2',3'-cyclic phosphodiesterase [Actinomycetota bacterium]